MLSMLCFLIVVELLDVFFTSNSILEYSKMKVGYTHAFEHTWMHFFILFLHYNIARYQCLGKALSLDGFKNSRFQPMLAESKFFLSNLGLGLGPSLKIEPNGFRWNKTHHGTRPSKV